MRFLRLVSAIAVISAALFPVRAVAQCDDWIYTPGHHAPFRAVGAQALTLYAPPGATVPRVIVGGQDLYLNGIDIHGIAQWDGTSWSPLGDGVNFTVMDTLVWNSPTGQVLVAGGNFSTAGSQPANYLAAWNGTSWSQIGGGVHQASGGWVAAMTVWDPDGTGPQVPNLVVAGDFARAGTVDCQNIARWDGTTWRTFGIGLDNWVRALTTWDPDGAGPAPAQLIATGNFNVANNLIVNRIARWDGVGWRRMGEGLQDDQFGTGVGMALTTWDPDGSGPLNSEVVVVGSFDSVDNVQAPGIAAWNGTSWHGFGNQGGSPDGVGTWDPDGSGPQFPQLIVGENLVDGNGILVKGPAMWNGSTFQSIGTFVPSVYADRFVTWDPDNAGPAAPRLIVAGLINGDVPTGAPQGVMQLLNNEWSTLNVTPNILAATTFGSRIVVGGQMHMIAANPANPFAPLDAANLAAWDGYEVSSFGNVSGTVRALKSSSNNTIFPPQRDLFVAGTFGGVASPGAVGFTVNNIARYSEGTRDRDGTTILPPGWFTMGQGFNSSVHALERFNNATYAGGSFTASGATATNRVARYDGSNWQPLGTGIGNGTVFALRVYNGALYAGGSFTTAGGLTTGGLARWNGSAWSVVSSVFSGTVLSLAVYNNELIIGGQFGAAIPNIIKFNGSSYSALGASGANAPVRALTVGPDGLLYIGGDFTSVSGVSADRIARWNGTAWSAVRGGVNGTVQALQSYRNEVHAGGAFGTARSGQFVAPAWARYTIDGIPWIARDSGSTQVCVGADAELFPALAPGYFPLTFQWRHNGVPFGLGPRPWGSVVEYAQYGLRIANAKPQDSGSYDFVATHEGCGSVTSGIGIILVCGADFNCDGAVDFFDYLDFVDVFSSQLPGSDYNSDGAVDFFDYLDFVDAFSAGC